MSEPGFLYYVRLTGPPPRDSCHWRIKGKRDVYCGMPCAGYYCSEHKATIDRLKAKKAKRSGHPYGMYGSGYGTRGE
jgi:hypothetical protein